MLSYISSHDTKLFFGDYQDTGLQRRMANSFMLLPVACRSTTVTNLVVA